MPDIAAASWKVSEAARRLHQDALVWDNHAGFGPDPSVDLEILEHWRAAGVDYLSVNVGYDVVDWQHTVKNIGAFLTWLEKHPDRFTLIRNADDILAAKQAGKLAIASACARCCSPITAPIVPTAAAMTRIRASPPSGAASSTR